MANMETEERDERADRADHTLGVEHRQPGENSFAMATVQRHRYRLQANAFYQQEWSARQNTPPSQTHPAFRQPDLISNLASPIPRLTPTPTSHFARSSSPHTRTHQPELRSYTHSTPPSGSAVTTMSSSQHVGRPQESLDPPLNLGTTPEHSPRPTQRAYIEDRQEQRWYNSLGPERLQNSIPVFRPPPRDSTDGNLPSQANADVVPASTPTNTQRERASVVEFAENTDKLPVKSSKKSNLFANLTRPFRPRRPSEGVVATPRPSSPTPSRAPAKASQLLGLSRSPSRTARLWGRKSTGEDTKSLPKKNNKKEEESHEPESRSNTSMGLPREGGWQSARSRLNIFPRLSSNINRSQGTPNTGLTRHHSLRYMDFQAPPTPPSKDTPPDERAIRGIAREEEPIQPFTNETPTKSTGFVSSSSRLSPSRSGSYGQRLAPRLATAPSMHSMRGSVAIDPRNSSRADLQEMNGRLGGLGLEGFSMPGEFSQRPANVDYSPSVYSEEWVDPLRSSPNMPQEGEITPPAPTGPSPQMQMVRRTRSVSVGTLHTGSASASADISYPELQRDPSIVDFQRYRPTPPSNRSRLALMTAFEDLDEEFQKSITPTAAGFQSIHPALRNLQKDAEASPASQHPSAQVSPLQPQRNDGLDYLQPLTYDPNAPGNCSPPDHRFSPQAEHYEGVSQMSQAPAVDHETPVSARRSDNIIDDRPILTPSNVQQARGVGYTPRSRRLPRRSDVSPSMLRGISETREETRAASPSRIPRPSRANQAETSRGSQGPASLAASVQTSRPTPHSLAANASVSRTINLRDATIRGFRHDAQVIDNALAHRLSQSKNVLRHDSGDDTGEDSAVGINDYKNNTGPRSSDAADHKRTSTIAARNFYLRPPPARGDTPGSSRSGTPSTAGTNDSEASTVIEHPNLPYDFPRPPAGTIITSSQVAGYAPTNRDPGPDITDSPTPAGPRRQQGNIFLIAADRLAASGGQTTSSSASTSSSDKTTSSTDTGSDGNAASAHTASSTTLGPAAPVIMAPTAPASGQSAPANTTSNTAPTPTASGNMPPTTQASEQAAQAVNPTSTSPAPPAAPIVHAVSASTAPPASAAPRAPVAVGDAQQPAQAQQIQLLVSSLHQQTQQMQQMTAQIQQLRLSQQAYQQANQQLTRQLNAQVNQTFMAHANQQATQQVLQQTNQGGHQAASQPLQHVNTSAQPTGQGIQQPMTQANQQADNDGSDEEEDVDDSWFNPG